MVKVGPRRIDGVAHCLRKFAALTPTYPGETGSIDGVEHQVQPGGEPARTAFEL